MSGTKQEALQGIELAAAQRTIARLREENGRMKVRLQAYRRQADDAMTERRQYGRARRIHDRLLWGCRTLGWLALTVAGLAFSAALLSKAAGWMMYLARR